MIIQWRQEKDFDEENYDEDQLEEDVFIGYGTNVSDHNYYNDIDQIIYKYENDSNLQNLPSYINDQKQDGLKAMKKMNKSIETIIDIITKIVLHDLKRVPEHSRTLSFLKSFDTNQ